MDITGAFCRTWPARPLFHFDSTPGRGPYRPVHKRLVADPGAPRPDNLEGLAFGARCPTATARWSSWSTNNFSARETNQFLAFEVLP
ncbi:hypothetical protein [Hymenobacter sp. PAMC 26628]|uniref:hypothetical protein n=1 Tax=Hymenobacter sp. PAMC 26628 TaxID=1484118 RepID=UPI00076FF4F8|nr:hypothetical protein [Hymenobacter sp. PAMC 26628]AMJ66157.1 hypothetical protein AXW84_12480 [Hymenobacter sp. PAMC 26628]